MKPNTTPIEILRELNLLDWPTLLVGFERGWTSRNDIVKFAENKFTAQSDHSDWRIALMAGGKPCSDAELTDLLTDYVTSHYLNINNRQEIDKWRLAHLCAISHSGLDEDTQLDYLEELYAEFGYPADMAACSKYYLGTTHTESLAIGEYGSSPLNAMQDLIARLKKSLCCNMK